MAANRVELSFSSLPKTGGAVFKTILAGRPAHVPQDRMDIRFQATWNQAKADPASLKKYRDLVGLQDDGTIPPMYIHAMVMPLRIAMFAHKRFPLRLMGLVHYTNRIDVTRAIRADETFTVTSRIDGIQDTDKGQSFDVSTELRSGDEVVWREVANFLSPLPPSKRRKSPKGEKPAEPDWGEAVATWDVPGNAGRVFSSVANDINPIHMSAITAKLFGFKRAIAHGMFSVGRCVARILGDAPIDGPYTVDVKFKRPLFIPGSAALHTIVEDNETKFLLKVLPKGEPHVEGTITRT
jgi:hypothetical protein